MIYLFIIISSLLHSTITHATSWGSNTSKDLKQPVNFSGKLSTHQGQEYIVDNISINNLCKKIPVYDKPLNHTQAVLNNDTKQQEIKLETNPADITSTEDLNKIKQISVPSPEVIWYYEQKKGRRQELIEITVTTNSDTRSSYLLDPKTPIYCDEIDAAGPQEKTVRLAAVKTLTIEGYTYRDTSKAQKECSSCPPCSVENK